MYPPHIIAVSAIFLAVVLRPAGQPIQNYGPSSSPTSASPLQSPGCHPAFSPTSGAPGNPALSASAAQNAMMGGLHASLKQVGPKLSKLVDWLAESKVDMSDLVDATQEMVSLYEVWEQYNERACKESITKFIQGMNK